MLVENCKTVRKNKLKTKVEVVLKKYNGKYAIALDKLYLMKGMNKMATREKKYMDINSIYFIRISNRGTYRKISK